jgi:CBS domain-containing protein
VDGGRLVGIVTETDLLRAFVRSADRAPAPHSS